MTDLIKSNYLSMYTTDVKFATASVISYTASKAFGIASAIDLRDSWHYQMLQELAFVAAIVSAAVALLSFHRNLLNKRKDKKNGK